MYLILISYLLLHLHITEALIESRGCIVNMASIMATKAGIGHTFGKLLQLTKRVALELAAKRVRVNCISPGPIKTNVLNIVLPASEDINKFWENLIEDHPMRQLITIEDIANLAVFLASDKAKSITGCDYIVNSGSTFTKFNSSFEQDY